MYSKVLSNHKASSPVSTNVHHVVIKRVIFLDRRAEAL